MSPCISFQFSLRYPGTAAGHTTAAGGGRRGANFDPLNQAASAKSDSGSGLDSGREQTPEDKIRALEKKVRHLKVVHFLNRFLKELKNINQCKDLLKCFS